MKNGGTSLVAYAYDANGERIKETVEGRDFYYSDQWQVLEERVSGTTKVQYVWSPVYVDGMILRDRDADGSGGNGLEERLYAIQDGNWNVTSVMNPAANVQERYAYDPFGAVSYLAPDWSSRSSSSVGWLYLHQGGRQDAATGLYSFRNRDFSVVLGRWLQTDPTGFAGGDLNFYRALSNRPGSVVDPMGLQGKPAKPDLGSGPVPWPKDEKEWPNVNQVGLDEDGNIIYGDVDYGPDGALFYIGKCFVLKPRYTSVPCPSHKGLLDVKDWSPDKYNCAGCAFLTWDKLTLDETQDRLTKKCKFLGDTPEAAKKECQKGERKCYLWTFRVREFKLDKDGKPMGPGTLREKVDFHIVCTGTGLCRNKNGDRPIDPRLGPPEVFKPVPYIYKPGTPTGGVLEDIKLKVYCCPSGPLTK